MPPPMGAARWHGEVRLLEAVLRDGRNGDYEPQRNCDLSGHETDASQQSTRMSHVVGPIHSSGRCTEPLPNREAPAQQSLTQLPRFGSGSEQEKRKYIKRAFPGTILRNPLVYQSLLLTPANDTLDYLISNTAVPNTPTWHAFQKSSLPDASNRNTIK